MRYGVRGENGQYVQQHAPDAPRECRDCGEVKDAEEFHVKRRFPDGSPRSRQAYCKDCAKERNRKRYNRRPRTAMTHEERLEQKRKKYRHDRMSSTKREARRAAGREAARRRRERAKTDAALAARLAEQTRRWHAGLKQDANRYEEHLAKAREREQRRRDELRADREAWAEAMVNARIDRAIANGEPSVLRASAVEAYADDLGPRVPLEPFAQWLRVAFPHETPEETAARFERIMEPRQVVRYLSEEGHSSVSLAVVDHIVTHGLGRPDLLFSLYPMEVTT